MGKLSHCLYLVELWCYVTAAAVAVTSQAATSHERAALEETETAPPSAFNHLNHYEILSASDITVTQTSRYKRGQHANTEHRGILKLEFTALGRHFQLQLTTDKSIFAEGFQAVALQAPGVSRRIPISDESLYAGHVSGELISEASVRWEGKSLAAKIELSNETYYIEPARRWLSDLDSHAMIAYRLSDLKNLSALPSGMSTSRSYCGTKASRPKAASQTTPERVTAHGMKKRSLQLKNTCSLLVIADYRFFKQFANGSETWAANYLIDLVNKVDKIYRRAVWTNGWSDMGFAIKKILIHTSWSDDSKHYNSHKRWKVDDLLSAFDNWTLHGEQFHEYCLVHLFTAYSGFNGVLGYSHIAGTGSFSEESGICAYYKNPPSIGKYDAYTNTGFSTLIAKGNRRLLDSEAELLLAHELGHNWGSDHDESKECVPEVNGGYLMSQSTTPYPEPNSKLFSSCSIESISNIITMYQGHCFEVARDLLHGNYRVDEGEECDEGVTGGNCCSEDFKLRVNPGGSLEDSCSDANDVCCKNCSIQAASSTTCRHSSVMDCQAEAKCDGISKTCPQAYKHIGTQCLPNTLGRCNLNQESGFEAEIYCAPLCETVGFRSCMCKDVASSCNLCCQRQTGGQCTVFTFSHYEASVQECNSNNRSRHCRRNSSFPSFEPYHWTNIMTFPVDTPCANGYCDSEGQCQMQMQDKTTGFFSFFRNLTAAKAVNFMKDNIVGAVILFSLVLWLPAVMIISRVDAHMDSRRERMFSGHSNASLSYVDHPTMLCTGDSATGSSQLELIS